MLKSLKFLAVAALTALSFVGAPSTAAAQDFQLSLSCPALPLVIDGLKGAHIGAGADAAALQKRTAKLYAERIDPTEVLLTEKEYAQLEKRLEKMIATLRGSDCKEFEALKKDQIKWQKELEDHVRKVVSAKDFKIDEKRELDVDPEKRDRPKNAKEQAELRRALIDFQMANYLASGVKPEEAKEKLIHRYELFTKRVSEQKSEDLYGTFLNAYANALDPHSTYFSPDDMEDFRIQMGLSLMGIGAVLSSRDGLTIVEEVVPGGAADRHGKLRPKDQIIAVAQGTKGEPVDVIDMQLRDVVRLIRGEKGTKVRLTVLRKEEETTRMTLTIERDKIDLAESAAKLHWQELKRGKQKVKVAVIDLPSFYQGDTPGARDSATDVKKLLAEAKAKNADAVVLDLSRNGGGSLQTAVTISGLFIELGGIVGVGGRGSAEAEVLADRDPGVQWEGPLVVLTSKVSASASEILAGTLQDYGRAVIVGDDHTYGKGTVQQLTQLPPGLGLLKVTTSLFYLPGGKSTQSIGVPSDIVVPSPFAPLEIGEKHQPYALEAVTTKAFASAAANKSKKWNPVAKSEIAKLAANSKARVAKSKEFKELADELAKRDPNDTKIKISEILKEGSKDDEDDEAKKKDDELSIQTKEAAEIAADLATAKN